MQKSLALRGSFARKNIENKGKKLAFTHQSW